VRLSSNNPLTKNLINWNPNPIHKQLQQKSYRHSVNELTAYRSLDHRNCKSDTPPPPIPSFFSYIDVVVGHSWLSLATLRHSYAQLCSMNANWQPWQFFYCVRCTHNEHVTISGARATLPLVSSMNIYMTRND